jgi:hypothetical protein
VFLVGIFPNKFLSGGMRFVIFYLPLLRIGMTWCSLKNDFSQYCSSGGKKPIRGSDGHQNMGYFVPRSFVNAGPMKLKVGAVIGEIVKHKLHHNGTYRKTNCHQASNRETPA